MGYQRARLIPVTGIGSEIEAERRAASAFLAVLQAVRDLSVELLSPLGASKATNAEVECFIEVPFKFGKSTVRPDGLISVGFGGSKWTALVEVKTGPSPLQPQQVNDYWDLAREHGFNAVVTISNEIAPPGLHPTDGLRVKSNSPVKVHHFSWASILSAALTLKLHKGVSDPDQAWTLGELIRYLEHPASGALSFNDMGPSWVEARDGAREARLKKTDDAVSEVASRWDQFLNFMALRLGAEIGETVTVVLSRKEKSDFSLRHRSLCEQLAQTGFLQGSLRIPKTAGDIEISIDLKARLISIGMAVSAPEDKGWKGRIGWLTRQVRDAKNARALTIEAWAKNAREPVGATLQTALAQPELLVGEDKREPIRFRVSLGREMGVGRKAGARRSFIDSVMAALTEFYEEVVQVVTPYTPATPKRSSPPKAEVELSVDQVADGDIPEGDMGDPTR